MLLWTPPLARGRRISTGREATGCGLPTDHSPQYSPPEALAARGMDMTASVRQGL